MNEPTLDTLTRRLDWLGVRGELKSQLTIVFVCSLTAAACATGYEFTLVAPVGARILPAPYFNVNQEVSRKCESEALEAIRSKAPPPSEAEKALLSGIDPRAYFHGASRNFAERWALCVLRHDYKLVREDYSCSRPCFWSAFSFECRCCVVKSLKDKIEPERFDYYSRARLGEEDWIKCFRGQ